MEFLELLNQLETSEEFKSWLNKTTILAHGFTVLNNKYEEVESWQIGYYDRKEDKITTFKVTPHVIERGESEEIFKRPETVIQELNKKDLKKRFEQIKKSIQEYQKEKYKAEVPTKIVVLVQTLPDLGTVWNVTLITQAFNTLNLKLDAKTGEVKEEKLASIMSYKQEE